MLTIIALTALIGSCARSWRATSTVTTSFEGQPFQVASGHAIRKRCVENGKYDSLWGKCVRWQRYPEYALELRWGGRRIRSGAHIGLDRPPPPLGAVRVRRIAPGLFAFQLGASRTDDGWFACSERDHISCARAPLRLVEPVSLDAGRAAAMAQRWRAYEIEELFGAAPELDAYAATTRDLDYLGYRWAALRPAHRSAALAEGIRRADLLFVREHWDDLDAAMLGPAVDVIISRKYFAFFLVESRWNALPDELRRRIDEAAIAARWSVDGRHFLEQRLRRTGDERVRRALEPR